VRPGYRRRQERRPHDSRGALQPAGASGVTSTGRAWLGAAVAAYLLLATGWLFWTPSLEGADESTHLQYALHIAQAGELPVVRGTAARLGLPPYDEETQAFHPPLYYASIAGFARLLGRADTVVGLRTNRAHGRSADEPGAALNYQHGFDEQPPRGPGMRLLLQLRGATIVIGLSIVLLTWVLGRQAFPGDPAVAGLAALLVASVPRFTHEAASVHNETLAAALSHGALALLLARRPGTPGAARAVLLGVVIGLALLTKLTALFLLPLAAFALLLPALGARRLPAARELLAVAAVFAVAAAVSGWWFVRNSRLYGDLLAMNPLREQFAAIVHGEGGASAWMLGDFLPRFLGSFVGWFGWFRVPPHPASLLAGAALVVAAALGWVLRARGVLPGRAGARDVLLVLVTAVLLTLAQFVAYNLSVIGPDCRYIFGALGPLAVLAAAGLLAGWRALAGERRGATRVVGAALAAALPLGSGALLVFQARPALAAGQAPAGRFHANLVVGIATPVAQPAIELLAPPDGARLSRPPVLSWSAGERADPSVPFTLDIVLPGGRPIVSTFEQFGLEITRGQFRLPESFWSLLPADVPVRWRVRVVPDRAAGQTELDAPASEFREMLRVAPR